MPDLLLTLIPLGVGSAIVPVQIIITILLLRAPGGRAAALAWVAGMTVCGSSRASSSGSSCDPARGASQGEDEASLIASIVLLVLALLLYAAAARQYPQGARRGRTAAQVDGHVRRRDPDQGVRPGHGAAGHRRQVLGLHAGRHRRHRAAALGPAGSIVAFLGFIALAESIHLALVAYAFAAPARADATLDRFSEALKRYNRQIVIALGLVFGTWFLLKALSGLGVL